jgi:hypothetical protein
MTRKNFPEILAELDATLRKLEQAQDRNERHDLLLALRLLIREVDQLVAKER